MILSDFEWCGQSASLFGLIPCRFSTSGPETAENGASLELTAVNVPGSHRWNYLSGRYANALTGTFQVCKDPCTAAAPCFSAGELRFFNRWLARNDGYHKFKIARDPDGGYCEFYFNAMLNVKKMEYSGNVIGLEITVTTDAPYAYFEPKTALMDMTAEPFRYTYTDVSDEVGRLCPAFRITCCADGDYAVSNTLSGIIARINGCIQGEILTMDSEHRILTSTVRGDDVMKAFNFGWLDIQNTYEERRNTYTSNLPCSITMTYSPIAKIGL